MLRKKISAIFVMLILNLNVCPAYSQEMVELSDSELDQILGGSSESDTKTVLGATVDVNKGNVSFTSSGDVSQSDALKALSSGNNTLNSVNVTDTAQQYLNSVVNVNAAGSIVPVQLNLTIIMNSTVGDVTSNNNLNLSFAPLN